MARAMRAWGEVKPKAILVMSRIFWLTDSIRPLDRPCSIAARIDDRWATMSLLQLHEGRDAAASGPVDPPVERLAGLVVGQLEDDSEAFLELVGPVQLGVGLRDPGQLRVLPLGQVLRVLPQREPGALERLGSGAGLPRWRVGRWPASASARLGPAGQPAGLVPRLPAHLIQCLGGPLHHVERVGALHRLGTALDDCLGDEVRAIGV